MSDQELRPMATTQTCYMCDGLETCREHAPPACFFPETKDAFNGMDLRRNLITVPSCDLHNMGKTKDDAYLWMVITASNALNECGQHMVSTKVRRSVERRPALGLSLLSGATPAQVFNAERNEWQQTVMARFDRSRFFGALETFGRALYFHHFQQKWSATVTAFPSFISYDPKSTSPRVIRGWREVLRIADRGFQNGASYGENHEAFFYQVHADDDPHVLIRATFYGNARLP